MFKKTQCINCGWEGHAYELIESPTFDSQCPGCGLFDFLIEDDELDQMNIDEPLFDRTFMVEGILTKHAQVVDSQKAVLQGFLDKIPDGDLKERLKETMVHEDFVTMEACLYESSNCLLNSIFNSVNTIYKDLDECLV